MSSPANAATVNPSISASIAVPLSIATGGRSSTAKRVRHCASPWRRASSAATPSTSSARSGVMRQCSVTLTPALRSTITPARRASASSAAAATIGPNGSDARIDPALAVDHHLHPVQAGERQTGHRHHARRGTPRCGRSRSRRARPGPTRRRIDVDRGRERHRVVGTVDDRRERAVVVEEDRGFRRPLDERVDHCGDVEHNGTLLAWTSKTAARETVGSNAQTLVGLSHRVHAHPELKFEEIRSSAVDRGRALRRGPDRRGRDLRPADRVLVPDRQRLAAPRDLRRVRRAARNRPRVRSQHHRGDRSRRRPGARAARRRSRSVRHRHRHAGRGRWRRQGLPPRTRRVRRCPRVDDGAPGALRGPHPARQRRRALRRQLRGPGVARVGRARARHQRRRRA